MAKKKLSRTKTNSQEKKIKKKSVLRVYAINMNVFEKYLKHQEANQFELDPTNMSGGSVIPWIHFT